MPRTEKQAIGDWGEEQSALFLSRKGYDIIERNYKIEKPKGEIDIIAWHKKYHFGKTLCFIEIKTRTYGNGMAERATKGKKMKDFFRAAKEYCFSHDVDIDATPIQFEQVSVYIDKKNNKVKFLKYEIPVES
jgi:putative endonuclease